MTRYLHNFCPSDAFGGNTFAMEIVDGRLFVGVAHCSEKDQYDKSIGRDIATSYLDELKLKYREEGIEGIITSEDIPSLAKITGFVVDDDIMYHILLEDNEWGAVLSHITVDVLDIDYMAIEGRELKEMLINYYNEMMDSIFEEDPDRRFMFDYLC